ncbi:MAG: glycosyltransferase family 4 protein [Xanthobacteraceae bacterium]
MAFAVPGDLATPTGGYVYDRHIVAGLGALGWRVEVLDLGVGFPRPSEVTKAAAHARLAALPDGRMVVIDGLALGVLPDTAEALHRSRRLVALVHHPLALESGLSESEAAALRKSECAALSCARRVIVTSESTARVVAADYGVPADRINVVRPGTERVAIARRDESNAIVSLLAVGSVIRRKGYDVLIAALAALPDRPWRLVIAGDRDRDGATAQTLADQIRRSGLADRVTLLGAVSQERLASLYAEADLFVLPSRFEGYGMAYTEAIAYGVPVIGTTAGAIPEAVPAGAGMLVAPDDAGALTAVLARLFADPAERERLSAGARAAAATLPTWEEAGRMFARALDAAA